MLTKEQADEIKRLASEAAYEYLNNMIYSRTPDETNAERMNDYIDSLVGDDAPAACASGERTPAGVQREATGRGERDARECAKGEGMTTKCVIDEGFTKEYEICLTELVVGKGSGFATTVKTLNVHDGQSSVCLMQTGGEDMIVLPPEIWPALREAIDRQMVVCGR